MYFERHYSLHLLFKNRVFVTFVTMKTRKTFWLLRSSVQNMHSDLDEFKFYVGTKNIQKQLFQNVVIAFSNFGTFQQFLSLQLTCLVTLFDLQASSF